MRLSPAPLATAAVLALLVTGCASEESADSVAAPAA